MSPHAVRRLVGVYHADGGIRGEVSYVLGSLLGTASCSLCHITHARVRRRREWDEMVRGFPVTFDLLHRNELEPDIAAHVAGRTPIVIAHTDAGWRDVLSPASLDGLDGSVSGLEAVVRQVVGEDWVLTPAH